MRLHIAMTGSHIMLKNFVSCGRALAISFAHGRLDVLLSSHLYPKPSAGEKICLYSARLASLS
jgi:hypothetical protein